MLAIKTILDNADTPKTFSTELYIQDPSSQESESVSCSLSHESPPRTKERDVAVTWTEEKAFPQGREAKQINVVVVYYNTLSLKG